MIADGKLVASGLKEKIILNLKDKPKKEVCFVIFGSDPASEQFIGMKCRFAETLGILTKVSRHPETLSFEEVKNVIEDVARENVAGIVIQLPLPVGLPVQDVLNLVPEHLDIDVLSDQAKFDYKNNQNEKIPPVSRAVSEILKFYNVSLESKNILVIGTGKLVGEPVASMLVSQNITFNVIDKSTGTDVSEKMISLADVIISGAGSPHMIKPELIKEGVVLIDAGTSEQNGKIVGDIDPRCVEKASLVTPVPGGVGPVTLASLFLNI